MTGAIPHQEITRTSPMISPEFMKQSDTYQDFDLLASLRVCTKQKDLENGSRWHAEILKADLLHKTPYLGNTLVNMYAKCGALAKASAVLDELPVRNSVSWNTLIAGYVQHGQAEKALNCYGWMQNEGLPPNAVTFACILKACASSKMVQEGEKVHKEMIRQGLLDRDVVLGASLVDMYAKSGILVKAAEVLNELPVQDVVTWNALIAEYAHQGKAEDALKCFDQMQSNGLFPDSVTFTSILKACGSVGEVDSGEQILSEIMRHELLGKDIVLGTSLVDMYAKCGALTKAVQVLEKLHVRDVVSWSALIAGYAQMGQGIEALECFKRMWCEGISPNTVTFICILKACGSIRDANKGRQVHDEIVRQDLLGKDVLLGNALVDMYIKCGAMAKAMEVHEQIPVRNVVSWSTLIAGYVHHGKSGDALKCFEHMQHEGFSPNVLTFSCLLKACGNIGDMNKGKQVHDAIVGHGLLGKDLMLGTTLVDAYIKCGAREKAMEMLEELLAADPVSWTAMIAGYSEKGHHDEALKYFERMQCESFSSKRITFICALKMYAMVGAVKKGEEIHKMIVTEGSISKDAALGNALVDMYVKCGMFPKAAEVIAEFPIRSEVMWYTLIAGCAQQGKHEEILMCFEHMQSEGLSASSSTLTCVLRACGYLKAVDKGQEVHGELVRRDLIVEDIILGTALVDMYIKGGALARAALLFDELPYRDIVAWSALIAGYAQCGKGEEALACYRRMELEGLSPNMVTFVGLLKACGSIGVIHAGKQFHAEIVSRGLLEKDSILQNALMDMYIKCGAFKIATQLIEGIYVLDVACWSTLIAGYWQQGHGEEALKCFEQMRQEGCASNSITYTCTLKACGSIGVAKRGEQIHMEVMRLELLEKDVILGACLVDMYVKCGSLLKAAQVLDELSVRDVVCWNALISGYAQQKKCVEALGCLERMKSEGFSPDMVTFTCILAAYCSIEIIGRDEVIHGEILRWGLVEKDVILGTSLLDMHVKCGALTRAVQVVDALPIFDVISWNMLILGLAQQGNIEAALKCFSWMGSEGLSLNTVTFTCILKVCGSLGAAAMGEQVHNEITRCGLLVKDLFLGTTLVDMYVKCGELIKAAWVLDDLPTQDVVPWSTLISGYAQLGKGKEALQCFDLMSHVGLAPDPTLLTWVLRACSLLGLVHEGITHFANMSAKYGIRPDVEHYVRMVDLFCHAGKFSIAVNIMKTMPYLHQLPICHALLDACQQCGDALCGRLAFNTAVSLNKSGATAYVLMERLYATR